jgi:hypothetical protein
VPISSIGILVQVGVQFVDIRISFKSPPEPVFAIKYSIIESAGATNNNKTPFSLCDEIEPEASNFKVLVNHEIFIHGPSSIPTSIYKIFIMSSLSNHSPYF